MFFVISILITLCQLYPLPELCPLFAFERAHYVRCDPAAVKSTGLGFHQVPAHRALVHPFCVKGEKPGDGFISRERARVTPGRVLGEHVTHKKIRVNGTSLEFAKGAAGGRFQEFKEDIPGWDVKSRRVRCLQDTYAPAASSYLLASEINSYHAIIGLDCRRSGIVPYRLLAGTGHLYLRRFLFHGNCFGDLSYPCSSSPSSALMISIATSLPLFRC